jgi:hypothetical protein
MNFLIFKNKFCCDIFQVRNLTRQHFGKNVFDSGGEIIHVDQGTQLQDACHGFESALLDQQILSLCDVLIISDSVFSQRAAFLRGRTDDVYKFSHGKLNTFDVNR